MTDQPADVAAADTVRAATPERLLLRLPRATWRALPALGVAGIGSLGVFAVAVWAFGPDSAWLPLLVVLLSSPAVTCAVDAVHEHLFADRDRSRRLSGRIGVTAVVTGVPAALASLALVAALASDRTGSVLFAVSAVTATLTSAVAAAVMVVALPVASARPDVALRTVAKVATAATGRRPLASVAALSATVAVLWLGLTWFTGLLAFVAPVAVVLSVSAAWPTVAGVGVVIPRLDDSPSARTLVSKGGA